MNILASALIAKCQRNIPDLGARVEDEDWFFYFTEAIREMRAGRTFPWQRRKITLELFTDIFKYSLPSDFDSPIKPHKDMLVKTDSGPYLLYGRDKDFFANTTTKLAINWERDVRTLLAKYDSELVVLMDGFDDTVVSNYTESGDINTLSSDNVYYKQGGASLRFNITSNTGAGAITRTIDTSLDLTEYLNKGYVHLWVYMPTVVDSVTIEYGNDSSNYYTLSRSVDAYGNAFTTGWNLIRVSMHDVTTVGSPDISLIDYFNIAIDHTGVTDTDFRIDGLSFHLPTLLELPYNSKHVVKDENDVYKESVTDGSDTILCDETFESIVMWKAIQAAAAFKIRDADLMTLSDGKTREKEMNLNRRYPSTEASTQSTYYNGPNI